MLVGTGSMVGTDSGRKLKLFVVFEDET